MERITKLLASARSRALDHPNILLALAAIPILNLTRRFFGNLLDLSQDIFFDIPNLRNKYGAGSWAVVTGATAGIGREFCLQLANQGFNIVLIARNKEKLNEVVSDINKYYPGILTRIVVKNFENSLDAGFFEGIYEEIKDLDISILVNNVGVADVGFFETTDTKTLRDMIIVNCVPITLLTRKLIPNFLTRKEKSAIINLSSLASNRPIPYMGLYSATKIFDDYLSRALALEYQDKLDVISLRPSFVKTAMSAAVSKEGFFHIQTHDFVKSSLKKLGRTSRTIGHWKHKLKSVRDLALISDRKLTQNMRQGALSLGNKKQN
jgi:17beta-estradiol 17-dehydrogenase / very-long-chain 3-oxoacyl-CoA reductase